MIETLLYITILVTIIVSICKSISIPHRDSIKPMISMKSIISCDKKLLVNLKSVYHDYKKHGDIHLRTLIIYREKIIDRFQLYKKINNKDIENPGISHEYINIRMEEYLDILQCLPPV